MKYVLILLLFVLVGLCAYIWYNINEISFSEAKSITIFRESSCNLQESSCSIDFNGDIGVIDISPKPFYLNERIQVKVTFPKKKTRSVQIDLKGLDMDMGFNRFSLKSQDLLIYQSSFNLPTCTKSYMPWLMGIFKNEETINTYKFLAKKREK